MLTFVDLRTPLLGPCRLMLPSSDLMAGEGGKVPIKHNQSSMGTEPGESPRYLSFLPHLHALPPFISLFCFFLYSLSMSGKAEQRLNNTTH